VGSFGKYLFEIKSQPGESFGRAVTNNGLAAPYDEDDLPRMNAPLTDVMLCVSFVPTPVD